MVATSWTIWGNEARRWSTRALLAALLVSAAAFFEPPIQAEIDVWIDPGHGGDDPGALGYNGATPPNEKELTIGVTTFLEGDLTGLGYIAHRTQNSGTTYFSPSDRRRIANGEIDNDEGFRDSCRLLISVHMNSAPLASVIGTETYHATIKYDAKKKTAYLIDKEAAEAIHPDLIANANVAFLFCSSDRGVKEANWAVLKGTRAPALLMEICFISNQCQFNNISTSGDQALIADGIAAGVSGYFLAPVRPDRTPDVPDRITVPMQGTRRSERTVLDEGFEAPTFPPPGWTTETAGLPVPHTWHRTTDPLYVAVGTGSALVGGESPSAIDEWLISPAITPGAADNAIRFLWSGSQMWSSALDASLNVREVGSGTWSELWSLAADEPAADPFVYRERIVDLSAWLGMDVEFGFRIVGIDGADFAIDDVLVGDFEPTAPASNDVCATAALLASPFDIQSITCYAMNDLDPFAPPPGSCVGNELHGPDLFYRVDAGAADTLRASVAAEWGVGVYLVDDCIAPVCLAGGYSEDARTAAAIEYVFPTTGTYYLVVDGEEGSCGPFELTGEVAATLTAVPSVESQSELNLLLMVRPNPARDSIVLQAQVAGNGASSGVLEIYTVAGARVWREHVTADAIAHGVVWEGRGSNGGPVPSGVYLARLQVGEAVGQAKITLKR